LTWTYAYTPAIWPSLLTTALLIVLAFYSGRRRSVPGALPFMIACLISAVWTFGSIMEIAAPDAQSKLAWYKFQLFWQLPAATAITCFVLEYAWPGRWLTRRNLILLSIPCLLVAGLILTEDLHHLLWRGFLVADTVTPLRAKIPWLFVAYSFGLALLNISVFVWLFIHSPLHRWPAALMIVGLISGRVLHLLESTRSDLPFYLPPVTFEYLMYAVALFGFRIFDPISLARQVVITQMREGVLVLDLQEHVVSLNPAAEWIFGSAANRLKGRPVKELLPAYPVAPPTDYQMSEVELDQQGKTEPRCFTLEISLLKDWRGLHTGHLLLLHDVTEQKRAQARLLEKERALAILHEREQLARELHDTTAQVLGYVRLQAQAARDLLTKDNKAAADSSLAQLAAVAREAQDDVREYIMGAKIATLASSDFLSALRNYLVTFGERYKLRSELVAPPDWSDEVLEPTVAAQLLRITQEALTNVRKHAQAQRVQVEIRHADSRVQIIIQDNGLGFDSCLFDNDIGQKYGLGFMRQRAEQAGGILQIESSSGEGTRVVVEVPVRREADYD
jgi:PAS domain S-box-containing protein